MAAARPKRTTKPTDYDPLQDWRQLITVHDTPDWKPCGRHLVTSKAIAKGVLLLVMPDPRIVVGSEEVTAARQALEGKGVCHDTFIEIEGCRSPQGIYSASLRQIENTADVLETGNAWYLLNHDRHPTTKLVAVRDERGKLRTVGWETVRALEAGEVLTFAYSDVPDDWPCLPHDRR